MKANYNFVQVLCALFAIAFLTTGFTFNSAADVTEDNKQKYLTDQIWAVQIEVEPGESGSLSQEFEAAYGSYDSDAKERSDEEVQEDSFGFAYDNDDILKVIKGEKYVGNYFHIEQKAETTGGTTKRYIDISSPWTGAYHYEDMTIEGKARIKESFQMDNLAPGAEAETLWQALF